MKRLLLLILTFSMAHMLAAQHAPGVVRGTVQDSATALPGATVSVSNAKDSALRSYTITTGSGSFEIKNIDTGSFILSISSQGFHTRRQPFTISRQTPHVNLGIVHLSPLYKTLDEVVVNDAPPIKVKGDTLSFNANAFKTKPDATAEDLLKKLPGVQVDHDGTVKTQGETVQKVYVDGKEFFGNDPKLATKNITADMIDEVQVYDDMSDQAKFNKIDDGSRSKAINLKLKKDKKRGLFGQAGAGAGTHNRYSANGRVNQFQGDRRVTLFANSNNTNQPGYTTGDLGSGTSFSGAGRGTSGGLVASTIAGLNYNDSWNTKVEIAGNYNFNHTTSDNARNSYRQNFFPTGTINDQKAAFAHMQNNMNRAGLRLTYNMNARNSFTYVPNISLQNNETASLDSTTSFAVNDSASARINQSNSSIRNKGHGVNWSNSLIWRKTFAKEGRTLSATFSNTYARNTVEGYNISRTTGYNRLTGAAMGDSILNQQSNRNNNSNSAGLVLSYTEPLGRDKIWEVNYSFNSSKNTADRKTYDRNVLSDKYDLVNEQLTNFFENKTSSNRIGTNFRVTKPKYNYQAGMAYASSVLVSNNVSKGTLLKQRYNNLFPTAAFNYQFARSKNLRINYRGATAQPSVMQLQPVADVSNPRYIREGNPALRQEFRNMVSLTYNSFNVTTLRNFFTALTFNNTYQKIVSSTQIIDSFGRQLVRPVNLNGAYNISGNVNVGLPIKKMEGGNFNATTSITYNHDPSLQNGAKSFSNNLTVGEDLRLNYNYKEKLDLAATAGINYTLAQYTVQAQQRDAYYTHLYGIEATYLFGNGFTLASDVDVTANTGRSDGFNQSYVQWNAAFARQLFKNKRGEVRASVFDILNQTQNLLRYTGENYIEDVQTTVLKRFFLLSFSYKVNRMGGKHPKGAKPPTFSKPHAAATGQ